MGQSKNFGQQIALATRPIVVIELKYIIVELSSGQQYGIIFPKSLIHKDVARIHRAGFRHVVSAGFCDLGSNGIMAVFGESESIGKKSRPEDLEILQKDFNRVT